MSSALTNNDVPDCELLSSELIYRAKEDSGEPDEATLEKAAHLVEDLEENEDCVRVWTTVDSYIRSQDDS